MKFNKIILYTLIPLLLIISVASYLVLMPKTYTITFESNGGSFVSSMTTLGNEAIVLPDYPTKTGYTFVGWYYDSGFNTSFSEDSFLDLPLTEDLTLYAKWVPDTSIVRTVLFDASGGTPISPYILNVGETLTLPIPKRTGYTFDAWYLNSIGGNVVNTRWTETTVEVNTSLSFYAKWIALSYKITYNPNGGINGTNPTTYTPDTPTFTLNPPTREGYSFVGWYTNRDLTGLPLSKIELGSSTNYSLYAKWKIVSYSITYQTNGGSTVNTQYIDYNSTLKFPPNPTKEGYTFVAWYQDEALNQRFTLTKMPSYNLTLYARWVQN